MATCRTTDYTRSAAAAAIGITKQAVSAAIKSGSIKARWARDGYGGYVAVAIPESEVRRIQSERAAGLAGDGKSNARPGSGRPPSRKGD